MYTAHIPSLNCDRRVTYCHKSALHHCQSRLVCYGFTDVTVDKNLHLQFEKEFKFFDVVT